MGGREQPLPYRFDLKPPRGDLALGLRQDLSIRDLQVTPMGFEPDNGRGVLFYRQANP
jgi:hypothetical protein